MHNKGEAELKEKGDKINCLQSHLPALFSAKLSKLIRAQVFNSNSNKKKLWFATRDSCEICTGFFSCHYSQTPSIGVFAYVTMQFTPVEC